MPMPPLSRVALVALVVGSWLQPACVSRKIHLAEVQKRAECEGRERVMLEELLERRRESAEWANRLAALSRQLGQQEVEIKRLQEELYERTAALGASAAQLLEEKDALERSLKECQRQVAQLRERVASVADAQQMRQASLEQLRQQLAKAYAEMKDVHLEIAEPALLLTLPDVVLFDKSSLFVSAGGRTLLQPVAELLSRRPEVAAEVLAYTDNSVPRGLKNIEDTWDWSLARATNVVRTLIQQFNVNANQLTPIGKGEYYPIASNETPEGRQRNRRTVIALYPPLMKVPVLGKD